MCSRGFQKLRVGNSGRWGSEEGMCGGFRVLGFWWWLMSRTLAPGGNKAEGGSQGVCGGGRSA